MMSAQAPITLCAFLLAWSAPNDTLAFTAKSGSARAIRKVPIASRNEWQPGVEIELPNLALLFDRVAAASPLARLVMEGNSAGRGFNAIVDDDIRHPELKWRKMENDKRRTVHRIDRADRFQNVKTPLLRFRSSINGPCIGERFSHFIMDLEERKKWDDQVANVDEMYPIEDLDAVDAQLGDRNRYGTCARVGVGYTQTKQGIISPREQLILGGMQQYDNGATILWGTEMEEYHDRLLPPAPGRRHTRAKSHLFAATLAPTGPESFDVEYLLQMDVGGGVPHFMTTPAIVDAVKKLFEHARTYFEGGELDSYLESIGMQQEESSEIEIFGGVERPSLDTKFNLSKVHSHHHAMNDNESLLFTP